MPPSPRGAATVNTELDLTGVPSILLGVSLRQAQKVTFFSIQAPLSSTALITT